MVAVLLCCHERFDPYRHKFFCDPTLFILFNLIINTINLCHINFFGLSVQLFSQILLVVVKHHHSEILCLMLIKVIGVADIVLFPDLVNDVIQ